MSKSPNLPPIYTVRGRRVMLDSDLARLYGVPSKVFNQTIARNRDRFPGDFLFIVTREELKNLRSQFVTSSLEEANIQPFAGHGGRRRLPWAFTEHGAIMAATILRSPRAVAMSVYVVRAFVKMKDELLANAAVLARLLEAEKKLITHDVLLRDVYEKLRPLLAPPEPPAKRELGFHTGMRVPPRRQPD